MIDVPGIFASNVFNDEKMRVRLTQDVYDSYRESIENGTPLDLKVANEVADAMKEWAIEKGCTHY